MEREDIRGYPYYNASPDDDERTVRIIATKNLISLYREWKVIRQDKDGNKYGPEQEKSYLRCIEILKQEGEKYP